MMVPKTSFIHDRDAADADAPVMTDLAVTARPASKLDFAAKRRAVMTRLAPLLACIGLLCLWQLGSLLLRTDSVPSALEALRAVPGILFDRESLLNILDSIRRMAIGLAFAVVLGIPLGLMMGRVRAVASFVNPLLMVTYPVPKAALMPIIMLWLGVGDLSKTLVIFLAVTLPIIYHSCEGARAVEEKMIWSGAAMGLSPLQSMLRVVLPAALPEILAGCRTGLVLALITMVTSEMIARKSGAGNILFNALDMGQYDTVFAMIIIIGALGIIFDAAFDRLRRALVSWSDPREDIPLSFS
jgi:NitT/TauT family transport system permease protein